MRRKPTVVSLYTGAGGIDYGFEAAGFRTAVALELDADCCETLRRNRRWSVIERSVFEVPTAELLEVGGLEPGEADVLVGGPPCQPFSKSAYWHSGDTLRLDDPRASTLASYLRVVEEAQPRVFLLENVGGLGYQNKSEGLELLLDRIEEINRTTGSRYTPSFSVVKAADYGVPQLRERFILVAARDGEPFRFPAPTHAPRDVAEDDHPVLPLAEPLPGYRTAWHALADVGPDPDEDVAVRGKWAGLLPSIPEGKSYLHHTDRGAGLPLFGWRRRYWSFLLKLAKDLPSWTIQAQPGPAVGPFHWENRRLSMRELCRLQTFPDDVVIVGSRNAVQRQLGNAVPSLLAETLARAIRPLLGLRQPRGPRHLLPPNDAPAPPPEPVASVPERYRRLVGQHEAHPGTGRGYRAQTRRTPAETAHLAE